MANTYVKIASVSVGVLGAASMEFTSIPATYTDLIVKISARSVYAQQYNFCALTVNSSTTGYSARYIDGQNSVASSSTGYTDKIRIDTDAALNTASTFGNSEIYIPNYAGSNNKSFSIDWVYESNSAANAEVQLLAALWSNSAAITSIKYENLNSSTFVQYSTATLYGILKS